MALWTPSPSVSSLDLLDSGLTTLFDDMRGPEFAGEILPVGVSAHRDDRLGTHLLRGEDGHEADGTVADDRDC